MNQQPPLVTIVIPTYNRRALLLEAIASVQQQDFSSWELIIADDGSTDETVRNILALNDPRIQYIHLEHTGNIAHVRNEGAKAGTGYWIAFLDADDIWTSNKLSLQLEALRKSQCSWSYGGFELMNEAGKTIGLKSGSYHPMNGWLTMPLLHNKASVAIGSLILSRDRFEELNGFDTNPGLLYREDYDLVLRLSLLASATAVPQTLVRIREHAGRSTNNFNRSHEHTAFVYDHFSRICGNKVLQEVALRRKAHVLGEGAATKILLKKYWGGFRQLFYALLLGATVWTIATALISGLQHNTSQLD